MLVERPQYDDFPSRPITIIVLFMPGGGGNVGALAVKSPPPDGYTLFMAHTGTRAVNVTLYPDPKIRSHQGFPADHAADLIASILVVPATNPARTSPEFVALAKAKPGGLSYASQGIGSSGHLLGEMFAHDTGTMIHAFGYARLTKPALTRRSSPLSICCRCVWTYALNQRRNMHQFSCSRTLEHLGV